MSNSITGQIRKSSFIVTGILLLFVVGMLVPYVSQIANDFFETDRVNVGLIAGHKVSHMEYSRLYQETRQDMEYRLKEAKRRDPSIHYTPQHLLVWSHESAWERMINMYAYESADEMLGLGLFSDEVKEMVLGNDLPAYWRDTPLFQDEKTGKFSQVKYLDFLQKYQETPQGSAFIRKLEKEMKEGRRQEKRDTLIFFTYHKTAAERARERRCEAALNVRLLKVSLDAIKDSTVRQGITEAEKKAYYKAHVKDFERKPSRTYRYVRVKVVSDRESERRAKAFLEREEIQSNFRNSPDLAKAKAKALLDNPSLTPSGWRKKRAKVIQQHEEGLKRFATRRSDDKKEVEVALDKASLTPFMKRMIKADDKVSEPIYDRQSYVLYRYLGKQEGNTSSRFFVGKGTPARYRFLKIVKRVTITREDNDLAFKDATTLLDGMSTGKTLDEVARRYGFQVKEEVIPLEEAQKIGRPVFREDREGNYRIEPKEIYWLYNDAKRGKAAFVEIENEYYTVAVWTQEETGGIAPYEAVAKEIEEKLIKQKKQQEIIARLQKVASKHTSLNEIKRAYNEAYGSGAIIIRREGVKFDDVAIEEGEGAPQAVGACFGLAKGEVSQPIQGQKSVMIIEHKGEAKKVVASKEKEEKARQQQEAYKQKVVQSFVKKNPKTVQDHRFRFRF